MVANKDTYRLCVVINAVINPSLITFVWNEATSSWVSDIDETIKISIETIPSYHAYVE